MKVRVLYPAAFAEMEKPPKAGDVIDVDGPFGTALVDAGYAEAHKAKVEKATAEPGEEKPARAPRKK